MTTIIGLTGTRAGMTPEQKASFTRLLCVDLKDGDTEFHHGDCVGADADGHHIAWHAGARIVIHPPSDPTWRAWCDPGPSGTILPVQSFHVRNHAIVDCSNHLLATPRSRVEVFRGSGTWATIRYAAREFPGLTRIIWPDGEVEVR